MSTAHLLQKRSILALITLTCAMLIAGCGAKGDQPATPSDVNAFNGGNGKMPADFAAKAAAAKQAAQQKAALQPAKR